MTPADPRAALLAELDALGDACAELGLDLTADPGALDPAVLAELQKRVRACADRLRGLMAQPPAQDGPESRRG
jgi:hypothetical protein